MQSFGVRKGGSFGTRLRYGCEASVRRATTTKLHHHQSIVHVSSTAVTEFVTCAPRSWYLPLASFDVSNYLCFTINPLNPNRNPLFRHDHQPSIINRLNNDTITSNHHEWSVSTTSNNSHTSQPCQTSPTSPPSSTQHIYPSPTPLGPAHNSTKFKSMFDTPFEANNPNNSNNITNTNTNTCINPQLQHMYEESARIYPPPFQSSIRLHATNINRNDTFRQQKRFGSASAKLSDLESSEFEGTAYTATNWEDAQVKTLKKDYKSDGKKRGKSNYGRFGQYKHYVSDGQFPKTLQNTANKTSRIKLDPIKNYKVLSKATGSNNNSEYINKPTEWKDARVVKNKNPMNPVVEMEPGATVSNSNSNKNSNKIVEDMSEQPGLSKSQILVDESGSEVKLDAMSQVGSIPINAVNNSPPDKNRVNAQSRIAGLKGKGNSGSGSGKGGSNLQQTLAREDEIEPWSLGGLFVVLLGASVFYYIYKVDQKKATGIQTTWLSKFGRTRSLEDFIVEQETKPIITLPDEWNAFQVIFDHIKNSFIPGEYNCESIISKLFRLFHVPDRRLLQPIKSQYAQRTLILDLDTICQSTWTRGKEYQRSMRPGYNEFLLAAAQAGWEICIFGSHEDMDWMESPDFIKLDGRGLVQHYLWNKDMYYFNGHRCKDLSRLNRNLSKVIVIDSEPRNVQMQPKNAIIIPKWMGEDQNDQELTKLTEFITYLQKADVPDVRSVLEEYRGLDIGEEFRRRYYAAILRAQGQIGEKEGEYSDDEEYDEEE